MRLTVMFPRGSTPPARMRAWTQAIDDFLGRRLATLREQGRPFDLVAEVAEPLPARMTSTILGLPIGAESTLHRFTDDFFAFFGASDSDAATVLRAQKAIHDARSFFVDVIADRRRSPGDDLLSHVVAAELAEPTLSDDELLALAMTIVAGAYGTTTHLIGSAVVASLGAPGTFAAIAADESFADAVVDAATSADDFQLQDVRRRRMSVYVRIPPNRLASARPLLNLFFSQLVSLNTQALPEQDPTLKLQCLLVNDEFTAMGRVGVITTAAAFLAGYNLRLLTVVQAMSQLDAVYGDKEARTFATNHGLQILYAPREQRDADEYSAMLGHFTERAT